MNTWYDIFNALLKDSESYVECDVPSHWYDAKRQELSKMADHFWFIPNTGRGPWCVAVFTLDDRLNAIVYLSPQSIAFFVGDISVDTLSSILYNQKLSADKKSGVLITTMRDAPTITVSAHMRINILSRVSK